jgi:hypothetical protein
MADNELVITLSLDDKVSREVADVLRNMGENAKKSTEDASKSFEDFGRSVKKLGTEIGHVSQALGFFGAGIIAPFAIALKDASKNSIAVSNELARLNTVTSKFQQEIATAVLPVIHQFANDLNALLSAFNSIPEPMRNMILQGTLVAGIFLVMTAGAGLFAKEILKLVGNSILLVSNFKTWIAIPANAWFLGVAAAIAIVVALMIRFKGVADVVMSTFEVLFRILQNGFLAVEVAFGNAESFILNGLATIIDTLAKIPGPSQKAFQGMAENVRKTAESMKGLADDGMQKIIENSNKMGEIFRTGEGDWSRSFQTLKANVTEFIDSHKKGNDDIVVESTAAQQELIRLSNELRDVQNENSNQAFLSQKTKLDENIALAKFYQQTWETAHAGIASFALTTAKSMQTNLSGAITNIVTGTMSAKQAFAELGKAMIKTIVDWVAQKLVAMALTKAIEHSALAATVASSVAAGAAITAAFAPAALVANIASFGGAGVAAAASFGVASAAEVAAMGITTAAGAGGLAEGTDTVPAMLSPGEMVFPRSMADAIRAGDISVGGPGGSSGGGDIEINLYGVTITSKDSVRELAEELGFELDRRLRNARSNL